MMTLEKHVLGTLKPSGAKVATENCYVTQSASTLLESLPYYYGCISREDAEWILYDEGCPDGMYLLRESGTDLVLSLCHHSSVLHYRINRLPSGDVVLSGLPQQTFASPMELIDTVDGLACKPTKPVKALFGKCLPPTHWGLAEEHIREQLIGRAADYGLTADQLAEALDCDLHFSTHFPPLVRSLIFKSLHEIQPWYHFRLSRTDAERRLEASGHQDGKFLVRERDESSYAICLSHESRVKHYRIDILPSGNFAIQDGPKFESIIALISHYTIFSGGLWCMLGEGCPRPQDLVRQYAEQSSAQLLQSSAAGTGHSHHHHHTHLALATSCRIESTHNHTAHQRSRSIDRYHRSSADLLVPAKQCKQCLQAVLSVHAANRVRVRRVSTPTNVKLKEWFTTINHKWARIKRQVILHHQRQQPLINEDNYGSTTYGTSEEISCCHVTSGNAGTVKRVPASTRKASKVTANLNDLLVDGTGHYHHCDHLHLPCSGAINYRYSNGYGTYGHRRQQFGRWHEEPAFGSRYAFDAENCDPNGAVNGTSSEQPLKGNPTSNSLTGTPNGKSAVGNNKNLNGFNHFDFHDENDNHIPEICPALIKSSSIDTIAAITDPIEEIRRLHLHQAHSPLPASICRNSIQTRDGTILQLDPTYRSFQSVLHPAAAAAKLHLQRTNSFDGVATTTNGAHCNCNCGDWLLDLNGDENDPFGSIMNTDEEGGGGGGGSDGEKPNEDKTLEELANIFTRAHQTQPLPPLLNGFSSPPNSTTSPVPLKETNNNNNNASSKPHLNGNSVTASHCNGLTQPANGFKTLPHLHNGLRAKALAVQKCSTSSSSGGTDSGSGSSGSCGPSGSSCKSNSSTGSGGPSSVYPTGFTSHHRSFSQATTVTMHNTMTLGRLPFRENNTPTLMDTTTSEAAEADSQPESITSLADIFEPTSTASGGKGGGGTAPIIDLLKEFDVCFNSAEHIDDDSSTLTDNSTHSFGSPHRRHCPTVNGFPSPPPATVDSLLSSPPSCTLPGQQVSTVPPPTLPPPPPPGSSGLSGSSSGCSTSLPSSQCAQGAAAASSCSSTTVPCKASPTPVPYGRETNDGQSNGLSGPSAADEQDIAVACTPTTADKLKDIELICLNEEPEEVQETIKKYRRGPICFDPRCISLRRRIGNGYFGDVFLATIPSSTHAISLAVKMLKSHAVPQQKAEILREAQTMAKLDHRHIVRLIGVCEGDPFMLVMELAPLGPLNKYLQNYGQNLTEEDILRLMHQVAKAMQYLEEMNCVHRDLAARNILLVSEKFAKVSDFGMSRALGQGKDYYKARSASKWPLKWYAPECIYYYKFSSKSDVWSYGIALWEALSRGEMPYQGMDGQDILKMFAENRRLAKPDKCPVAIYQLMWSCWQFKPEDRLNFAAINDQLTHHLAGK